MPNFHLLTKSIYHHIRNWSKEKQLFVWSLLFSSILFFVPSNKVFLLVSLLFVAGLYLILKSLVRAVLYSFIFLLPFQNGKGINFLVVPGIISYEHIPFFVSATFTVSGMLSVLLLYIYLRDKLILHKDEPAPHLKPPDIFLGIFILSNILASILSNIPWLSFLLTLQMCEYIFVYYYIETMRLNRWVRKSFLPLISSISIFEGLWAVLQYVNKGALGYLNPTENMLQSASEDELFFRMQGTFSHPNFLGIFMAVFTPMLFSFSVSKSSTNFGKIISMIGCVLGLFALILSGSRASWICFGIGMFILIRSRTFRESLFIIPFIKRIYLGGLLLLTLAIPIMIIPRFSQLAITLKPEGGFNFRVDLIEKALLITSEHPFGIGLGTFPQIVFEEIGNFTHPPTQPHNLIAQVLVSSGYIGALSFCAFIYLKMRTFVAPGINVFMQPKHAYIATLVSLGIFFCLSMLYPILTEQSMFAWMWILLSIIV